MATHYGLGTEDAKLNTFKLIRAGEYTIYFQMLYYISLTITKNAIAFIMLRSGWQVTQSTPPAGHVDCVIYNAPIPSIWWIAVNVNGYVAWWIVLVA